MLGDLLGALVLDLGLLLLLLLLLRWRLVLRRRWKRLLVVLLVVHHGRHCLLSGLAIQIYSALLPEGDSPGLFRERPDAWSV